ncbi:molybdopterin molybdotransferase MoeA [Dactylosporangium sp. CA-092794]|uniref:molybdopterin molybdotransferase MoeA n=1 Tax=Dactylosporangium sp. CA-092794 TaxID=3239929 RepID=UPI003D931388
MSALPATTPLPGASAPGGGVPDVPASGGGVADVPWDVARDQARRLPAALGVERVPVDAAHGRVLAERVCAAVALPGCDIAAMDGYAVAGPPPWRVIGRVFAGPAVLAPDAAVPLVPGTAVEIGTGARVPAGATAVVPYERCRRVGAQVTPLAGAPGAGAHIRVAGEDARPGDEIVPAGRPLSAAALGAAAQAGVDTLAVRRRPRVHIVVTGDEVVRAGLPGPGLVRDAFGPMVAALAERAGGVVTGRTYLPDDHDALLAAVDTTDADVLVVTGSSSVGAADHLHRVLGRVGARVHVDGVRCRPGHPQVLARAADGRWLVGLPGNPFAGLVAAVTLLEPVVEALAGRPRRAPAMLPVSGAARSYPLGVRLVPVRVEAAQAVIVPGARPGGLRAVATADALAVIRPDWTPGAVAELVALP